MSKKVLIVEDNELNLKLFTDLLRAHQFEVEGVRDGRLALEQARMFAPDLVIMDLLMPDQDGLEAIMTLRREFPDTRVIAMTGASDTIGVLDLLDVAKMFGARRTLHKPFELNVLLDAVAAELTV